MMTLLALVMQLLEISMGCSCMCSSHKLVTLLPMRATGRPGCLVMHKSRFGMLFKIGTLEDTKDRSWCWVLSAPIELLKAAGVAFDPHAKDMKSLQGESGGADSALRVHLFTTHSTTVPCICSFVWFVHVCLSVLDRHC